MDKVRSEIAKWYEAQTDRVTGWYKAFARKHLLVFGLLAAVLFNIDTIAITKQIAAEPGLRQACLWAIPSIPSFKAKSDRSISRSGKVILLHWQPQGGKSSSEQAQGLPFG
jgi:hypothetical protein